MSTDCVILFSGGTDSTCAAALAAEKHDRVHLLTLFEQATENSPLPLENVRRLRAKYGEEKFSHHAISTDRLVRRLSYESYLRNLIRHGPFMLSTPGFSSLSWHLRAITYCLENQIHHVYDGMTRELLHLPGHMPRVREIFADLYQSFGIHFSSPVIDWEVPPDQRFTDRLIVDRHGFAASDEVQAPSRTTGSWLYEKGIFPRPNVKGSLFDHRMQHDCYPFVVYNIFAFWLMAPLITWKRFEDGMVRLFREKAMLAGEWVSAANSGDLRSRALFEPVRLLP